MSDSLIEWLRRRDGKRGKTWNFLKGCDAVSEGCDGCYAVPQSNMRASNPNPKVAAQFAGLVHRVNGKLQWTGKVNFAEHLLHEPMKWKDGHYVFVNALADLFHKEVSREIIAKAFAVMALTPQHVYIILTKRPGRMQALLSNHAFWTEVGYWALELYERYPPHEGVSLDAHALPNVILGVSVENHKWADVRIPPLLNTPAAYRALSAEPLLGPLYELDGYLRRDVYRCKCGAWEKEGLTHPRCAECGREWVHKPGETRIDLVIGGGESGPGARPVHPDWVRRVRDETKAAGACFFFKQWGEWGPAPFIVRVCDPKVGWQGTAEELEAAKADSEARGATHIHTGNPIEDLDGNVTYHLHEIGHKPWSPERAGLTAPHEPMRRWGKKRAGKVLDGREWTEMPVEPVILAK